MVRLPLTLEDIERGRRLGALLRRARGTRSMLDVALDSGVSPETVRKIESGRVATPSFPTVAAIARVLGLSLDTLWDEVNVAEGEASAADDSLPGRRLPGDPLRKRSPVTASGADASASRR